MATMDAEDCIRTDVDTVTVLPCEGNVKQDPECSEVEDLQNSLRQALRDEAVRPKMQCLMMDPSFSIVTMQGEDSGIEWETGTSHCPTPWVSASAAAPEPHTTTAPSIRPATPGAPPAGRIIIVMDEENISRRKRTKEPSAKQQQQQPEASEEQDGVTGRPELVGFSLPNVKPDQGQQKEAEDAAGDREHQVFCLVAEGSEILNIVVPPVLASVDEEESTAMEDNLSYLEQSRVIKSSGTTDVFELNDDAPISTEAADRLNANGRRQAASNPHRSNATDPPGAPVTRPPTRETASNVDYFENFTLVDAQAPGSPAVVTEDEGNPQMGEQDEVTHRRGGNPEPNVTPQSGRKEIPEQEEEDGEEDMACTLLDDVFYGGTADVTTPGASEVEECRSPRSPLKQSGSALFGSQEEILTPIFLPEGPAKIIDPILFEEPKAMAFLYTDLYEEATGCRLQEEDTQSLASEKSFHSRHSDREARGYLEKYMLKDETPVLETTKREHTQEDVQGVRLLSQDSNDFGDVPGKTNIDDGEDEITDFFRSSGNSSPCDMNPFAEAAQEEDAAQAKLRARQEVIKATQQMFPPAKPRERDCTDNRIEQTQSSASYEFVSDGADWSLAPGEEEEEELASRFPDELGVEFSDEGPKPAVPPRKKVATAPKTSLDLTPLSPVQGPDEGDEAGMKEQRVEDKETASPAETADEADGEEESSWPPRGLLTADTSSGQVESAKDEGASRDLVGNNEAEEHTDMPSTDIAETDLRLDQEGICVTESTGEDDSGCPQALVSEPAKEKGRCIIL